MFKKVKNTDVFEVFGRTYALLGVSGKPKKIPSWLIKPGWLFTMNESGSVIFMWNRRRSGVEMLALDVLDNLEDYV